MYIIERFENLQRIGELSAFSDRAAG